ncbi:MAG TPA: hypothetical protein VGB19_11690 [Actinomycetota bacterium]
MSSSKRPRSGAPPRRGHRIRLWIERAVLGGMMTVVAAVVERKLLKAIRSGPSPKKALEKAARNDGPGPTGARAKEPAVGVGLGSDGDPTQR